MKTPYNHCVAQFTAVQEEKKKLLCSETWKNLINPLILDLETFSVKSDFYLRDMREEEKTLIRKRASAPGW